MLNNAHSVTSESVNKATFSPFFVSHSWPSGEMRADILQEKTTEAFDWEKEERNEISAFFVVYSTIMRK